MRQRPRLLFFVLGSVVGAGIFFAYWQFVPIDDPFDRDAKVCRVDSYGARKSDARATREAFSRAFAECAPGGTVLVPRGEWTTGGIVVPSDVTLRIVRGATLSFSDNPNDYLPAVPTRWEGMDVLNYQPLIYAPSVKNVAIIGRGVLKGNGQQWWEWKNRREGMDEEDSAEHLYEMTQRNTPLEERVFGRDDMPLRPSFLQFYEAESVVVDGVTFVDGPMWTIHPVYSKYVTIRHVEVYTTGANTDGIAIDSSENVLVEHVKIYSGDDAIVLKSGLDHDGWRVNRPTKNITVRDAFIGRGNGGVVIGSEMSGGVENVIFEDIRMRHVDTGIRLKTLKGRGGYVRNIRYEDIDMRDLKEDAVQYDTRYKFATFESDSEATPEIRDISFDRISVRGANRVFRIGGRSDSPIHNLSLKNSQFVADMPGKINDIEGGMMQGVFVLPENNKPVEMENVKNMSVSGYFPRGGSGDVYVKFQGKRIENATVNLWPCPDEECVRSDDKVPDRAVQVK